MCGTDPIHNPVLKCSSCLSLHSSCRATYTENGEECCQTFDQGVAHPRVVPPSRTAPRVSQRIPHGLLASTWYSGWYTPTTYSHRAPCQHEKRRRVSRRFGRQHVTSDAKCLAAEDFRLLLAAELEEQSGEA